MRVVLDTNQILAAGTRWLLCGGPDIAGSPTRRVLVRVVTDHTGLYSGKIIGEYTEKLVDRHHSDDRVLRLITLIMGAFERVQVVTKKAPTPPTDPDDEIFLLCALDGNADYLVTEDHSLLNLRNTYDPPKIGTSSDVLGVLGA